MKSGDSHGRTMSSHLRIWTENTDVDSGERGRQIMKLGSYVGISHRSRDSRRCWVVLLMIVSSVSPSFGQTLRSTNLQVGHESWTFKDGAPPDVACSAQTNDGFLWLCGGPNGLVRFDGTRFEPFSSVHYSGLAYGLRRGPVEEVPFAHFARGQLVWVRSDALSDFDVREVICRTRSRVGEDRYRLLTNNCEHFCEWCLHGAARSFQVEAWLAG